MIKSIPSALLLVALPVAFLFGGGWIMDRLVGRQYVKDQLREKPKEDQVPLNLRRKGYDVAGVERYWGALDHRALAIEQRFLKVDLVFPLLYGAVLAGALFIPWAALGRPFHFILLILPVVIVVLGDWAENLIQLSQLQIYLANNRAGLQADWIRIASAGTMLKLWIGVGAWLFLCYLVWMVLRPAHPPS